MTLNTLKTQSKKALHIAAVSASLAGVLSSCDTGEIIVSQSQKTIESPFTFISSRGGSAAPDKEVFELKVQEQDGECVVQVDGPWSNDRYFAGKEEKVFQNVHTFLQQEGMRVTRNDVVVVNISDKLHAIQTIYRQLQKSEKIYDIEVKD